MLRLLTLLVSATSFTEAVLSGAAQRAHQIKRQAVLYPRQSFQQAIDHFPDNPRYAPHDKGTFNQNYVYDASHYKAGGPVFVQLGGEAPLEYWEPLLTQGVMANLIKAFNGLGIIVEGRYYGDSYPYNTSTTDQLVYLTTEQTLADFQYFAEHVTIAHPGIGDIRAPKTPWIVYGGSFAGAHSAFTMKTYGDTFYGGIASSGVIHGVTGYYRWYDPIQKYAAQDCVASINDIVDKIDTLVNAKNDAAIAQLKEIFGLSALQFIGDFAQAISFPIGSPTSYPTSTWQEINWNPAVTAPDFFYFCRNVTDVNAPASVTAVDNALAKYTNNEPWTNLGNYAAYFKRVFLPLCPSGDYNSVDCFGTRNQTYWADPTNSDQRSYLYGQCTEFGFYQVAPPAGKKSLISRVLDTEFTQQVCDWAFPKGKLNHIPPHGPNLTRWNSYGGYNVSADRLAYISGGADPWLDACYHSNQAPPRYSTELHPEMLINGAGHIWDANSLSDDLAAEPQFIQDAHLWEIRTVARWLKDFKSWTPGQS